MTWEYILETDNWGTYCKLMNGAISDIAKLEFSKSGLEDQIGLFLKSLPDENEDAFEFFLRNSCGFMNERSKNNFRENEDIRKSEASFYRGLNPLLKIIDDLFSLSTELYIGQNPLEYDHLFVNDCHSDGPCLGSKGLSVDNKSDELGIKFYVGFNGLNGERRYFLNIFITDGKKLRIARSIYFGVKRLFNECPFQENHTGLFSTLFNNDTRYEPTGNITNGSKSFLEQEPLYRKILTFSQPLLD